MFELFKGKKLSEIEMTDIEDLIERKVPEGWYVEYKGLTVKKDALCKTVCAFANNDGGWLILGVNANNENTPTEIVSFMEENEALEDWFGSVINSLKPIPSYEVRIVKDEGKRVAIIRVSKGWDSPYLTPNGSIYKRINHECKKITDPYDFERLYQRKSFKEELEKNVIEDLISIQYKEYSHPYFELHIFPEGFEENTEILPISENFFDFYKEKINSGFKQGDDLIPFNINMGLIQIQGDSVIIRAKSRDNPYFDYNAIVKLRSNGVMSFYCPLNSYRLTNEDLFFINKDVLRPIMRQFVGAKEINNVNIIDGFNCFFMLFCIISPYQRILEEFKKVPRLSYSLKVSNILNSYPHFECELFYSKIKEFGLPISPSRTQFFPEKLKERTAKIKNNDDVGSIILSRLMKLLGVSADVLPSLTAEINVYIDKLTEFYTQRAKDQLNSDH